MLTRPTVVSHFLLSAILLTLPPLASGSELYRYTNAEGTVVIDHRIPPQYVAQGYEVLNDKGVVVRVAGRTFIGAANGASLFGPSRSLEICAATRRPFLRSATRSTNACRKQ